MAFKRILLLCCLVSFGIAVDNNTGATDKPQTTTEINDNQTTIKDEPQTTTEVNDNQTTMKDEPQQPKNQSTTLNVWDVKKFNYVLINEATKVPCTLTKMNITLTIPYKTKDDKIVTKNLTVPLNATVNGTCSEKISIMTLIWQESEELGLTSSDNELSIKIVRDGDVHYVQFLTVSIALDKINFPNATEKNLIVNSTDNLMLFQTTSPNNIYICNNAQVIKADGVTVTFDNIQLIAFNTNGNSTLQKKEEICPTVKIMTNKKKTKNIGIIVAAILIALVGITLIIFIVNRYSRKVTSWNITKA